ncbi:M28 family peptidase [Plantactinospora soyae]|uniref:Peptidase M28 domain-containing protein n=1 Tax=Plantactinospora soyae TaxID=1544732 RepID=A0A927M6U2_9ACTN|nr:M28 family peptidase [Plantactinospora soyae]MBE1485545.1 hypothetical protein [Plantactinospora soyae]
MTGLMGGADELTPEAPVPPAARPDRAAGAVRSAARSHLPAFTAGAVLVAIALLIGFWSTSVPSAAGADAAADQFSADRAYQHLVRIGRAPHPSGTDEADAVRGYVIAQLTALGLRPEEQDTMAHRAADGWADLAGRVHNVVATVPGTGAGTGARGRVVLMAHTDSTAISHGASDDGRNVAALLEIARALRQGPGLRNDVTLVFTDSEEFGQLGAGALLRDRPPGTPRDTVVLNLEARGTSGRVVMFETGPGSGGVVGALSGRVPMATSFSAEVYRRLPNDTDFTQFKTAGYAGMNFAVIGGSARYHTAQDNLATVDRGSVQDMGDTVLAATRELGDRRLSGVASSGEATWFSIGPWLVRYPAGMVLPLAALAVAATVAACWYARRRRALGLRGAGVAAATFPLAMVAAGAVGWATWRLLDFAKPEYGRFLYGDPYRTAATSTGLVVLAAAVAWVWLVLVRRRVTATEAAAGLLVWLSAAALLTAVSVPGAAYLFTWAALTGAAGLAAAARLPGIAPWRPVLLASSALPLVLLLAPLLPVLLRTVGLGTAAAPLMTVPLLVGVLFAVDVKPVLRRARILTATLALAGVLLMSVGAAVDRFDPAHPLPVSLMYALDADTGQAQWMSADADPDRWVGHYVTARRMPVTDRFPNLWGPAGGYRVGDAPTVAALPRPVVRSVGDERDGTLRRLRLQVSAESGRPILLALYLDTSSATVLDATIAGLPTGGGALSSGRNVPLAPAVWKWGVMVAAPPDAGFEVSLRVRADGPVRVLALAQAPAIPAQALDRPLPADRTWAAEGSGLAFASRTYQW